MTRNIFVCLFIIALSVSTVRAIPLGTDTVEDKLTLELDYSSNSLYAGFANETRYPYISPYLFYKRASGFWLAGSVYKLVDETQLINEVDLSAGYDFRIKKLYASLNYTRLFFNPTSVIVKSSVRNTYEFYLGRYFKALYTSVQADYNTGLTRDLIVRAKVSRYFGKDSLLSKYDGIGFDPQFAITMGTHNFYETNIEVISPNGGKSKGKNKTSKPLNNITYEERTGFKPFNFQFNFPLTYYYNNTSLEAAWHLILPLTEGYFFSGYSYYTLSLYHNLYFKRAKKKK